MHSTAAEPERAFLVGVERTRGRDGASEERSLDELELLAETAGAEVVGRTMQRLESPHPATYVGKGKLEEIKSRRARATATRW